MTAVNEISEVKTLGRLVAREDLCDRDTTAMFELLDAHFEGVSPQQFHRDLQEKNFAILIERGGHLVGFSTIAAYETSLDDQPISVICSGDTIVSPAAWNSSTLPRVWIESVAAIRRHYPRGRYVWLLITSGFRTYRFLPLFWREFYPRFDGETPQEWQTFRNRLAAERFGAQFDASIGGVVRFEHPQRLRDSLAGIPEARRDDPHVAFFASQNPGHANGDELVCVTELTPQNLTPAGRRMAAAVPTW